MSGPGKTLIEVFDEECTRTITVDGETHHLEAVEHVSGWVGEHDGETVRGFLYGSPAEALDNAERALRVGYPSAPVPT